MGFFYQIFIHLFGAGLFFYSFFNSKASRMLAGRRKTFELLRNAGMDQGSGEVVWVHCASLGEFEQARPLISQLKINNATAKIAITFFSPSGYEVRREFAGVDVVCYLPGDTAGNVHRFLDLLKPTKAFFVKYDYWYNYLHELRRRDINTYLVSANFRKEQFAGLYGSYLKKVLACFTKIFVQTEGSVEVLSSTYAGSVIVSGDMRFDRVTETVASAKRMELIEHFKGSNGVIIGGSTWLEEEKILAEVNTVEMKLIVAPHDTGAKHVLDICRLFESRGVLRYSEVTKMPVTRALDELDKCQVLVIDSVGLLSGLYKYATLAFIGGGFGAGLHNYLEAAAFGVPVVFGPNHEKFPDAAELINAGGAFCINGAAEFKKVLELLSSDEKIARMASMTCSNFVQSRRGATEKILMGIS